MNKRYFPGILSLCFCLLFILEPSAQSESRDKAARDSAGFCWPQGIRAAVSLTFDDARPSQVDIGLPILDKYGVRATFYVSPENIEQRLAGWKKALAGGHEIGNHTLTHPCTGNYPGFRERALEDMTLSLMAAEIDQAGAAIARLLSAQPRTFAYPCGETDVGRGRHVVSFVPLVAERFLAGRKWLSEDSNDPAFCDLAQLLSSESDGRRFAEIKPLLDRAASEGRWLILTGHEIGAAGSQTTLAATLEELCRYASDPKNGLWIDTMARIGEYVSKSRSGTAGEAGPSANASLPAPALGADQNTERRIDDLIRRMTLEDKVGQMNMPCVYEDALGESIAEKTEACRRLAEGTYVPDIGPIGGFFTLPNTILHEGPRRQAEFLNELQTIARRKTRLGIPLLLTEEGTHGLMCPGATVFPEGPALGSTWNLDLVSRVYAAAAEEARAIGIHQIFTLVVEPVRDPRLGRNQEAYSEDPYLCARFAETIVRAVQGNDVSAADKTVAGLCHYPGQSQPVSGLERGAMEVSERLLRSVFLPPWEAGIKSGGALGVMATYPSIDGTPAHASEKLLTGILRGELGFQGIVLSEGGGIGTLVYEGLASSQKEAGQLALRAGVDVGISYESGYMKDLIASVKEGKVPMELIDRAVRRILRQKARLGLFENAPVDPERAEKIVHSPDHQKLALEAARQGIVLLKNENHLLPLRKDIKSIAVIGPNADQARNQLGDYVAVKVLQDVETVLDGIKALVSPQTYVRYVKGCDVVGTEFNEIDRAREAAAAADAAVVVVGENEWQTEGGKGTSGEGYDSATLELTGLQEELVRAVVETKTPTIVVLVNGRPLAVRFVAERVPAVIEAWPCGEKGGLAVAEVLFGDVNPSGRLPVTVPRHAGQLPVYYNAPRSKAYWIKEGWGHPYADLDPAPLFPFGHGLSYTTFRYENLRLSSGRIGPSGSVEVSIDLRNTGDRFGEEVVQLYIQDVTSSVSTPIKELKGFAKIGLEPGKVRTVRLLLTPDHLALTNRWLDRVVEPGPFKIYVGSSSEDIRLQGGFEVTER
jgi:beta-glucosidase-like glycosyl hydrolase/peptidoglycan/xylan/chitin deacetylase (PgdA/CDA1 family)